MDNPSRINYDDASQIPDLETKMSELLKKSKNLEDQLQNPYNGLFNWIFPISTGTLVWMMSNFDKFVISDIIPDKGLYSLSYYLILISTVILGLLQSYIFYKNYSRSSKSQIINDIGWDFEIQKNDNARQSEKVRNSDTVRNAYIDLLTFQIDRLEEALSQDSLNRMKIEKAISRVSKPLTLVGIIIYFLGVSTLGIYYIIFLKFF